MSTVPGFPNVDTLDDDDLLYLIRGLSDDRDKNIKVSDFRQELNLLNSSLELILAGSGIRVPLPVLVSFQSNDTIAMTFLWGQIPKQGPTFTIVYGGGAPILRSNGSAISLDATFTEGAPIFNGNTVSIILTKVGAFAVLGNFGIDIDGWGTGLKAVIS